MEEVAGGVHMNGIRITKFHPWNEKAIKRENIRFLKNGRIDYASKMSESDK